VRAAYRLPLFFPVVQLILLAHMMAQLMAALCLFAFFGVLARHIAGLPTLFLSPFCVVWAQRIAGLPLFFLVECGRSISLASPSL